MAVRLSEDEFCQAVDEVVRSLPAQFLAWLENVVIEVERYPDARLQRQMKLGPRHIGLMGLFEGHYVTKQEYGMAMPNRILLFQRAIGRRGSLRNPPDGAARVGAPFWL